jgi:hypothetical protein
VLIIGSDVQAAAATKVVIVTPLPCEPRVSAGPAAAYTAAHQIIVAGLARRDAQTLKGQLALKPADAAPPEAQPEKPPRLDLTIEKPADRRAFQEALFARLTGAGAERPTLAAPLASAVDECLKDGFGCFALRVVELKPGLNTVPPVLFRFASTRAYYPLRIARGNAETASVRLLMVTPRLLTMPDVGAPRVKLMHQPVSVGLETLRGVDAGLAEFFADRTDVLLRHWECKGKPTAFKRDIWTSWY